MVALIERERSGGEGKKTVRRKITQSVAKEEYKLAVLSLRLPSTFRLSDLSPLTFAVQILSISREIDDHNIQTTIKGIY